MQTAATPSASDQREPSAGSSRRVRYLAFGLGVLAIVGLFLLLRGRGGEPNSASADIPRIDKAWYSTDDGKTWFADDKRKLPPFDHDGKLAVRCWVYSCDGGKGAPFAAYLERFEPSAKQRLETLHASKDSAPAGAAGEIEQLLSNGLEVKKPGAGTWVPAASSAGLTIRQPTCPSDPTKPAQLVLPPSDGR